MLTHRGAPFFALPITGRRANKQSTTDVAAKVKEKRLRAFTGTAAKNTRPTAPTAEHASCLHKK